MQDHAGFFRIFWEHSRRAPGRRARGPATTPDFRRFCARGLGWRCRLRHYVNELRAGRSPRADAAVIRAPPTGGTDAIAPKAAPKSAANICDKDTLTRCRACCAAGCGQSAPHNTSLARAYSAAAFAPQHLIASAAMPVRRGARPGREHHHRTHTTCAPHAHFGCAARPRVADQRRCWGCSKQPLGVVAPASASAFA